MIRAIYFDEYGKRIGESVEDESDFVPRRERTQTPQVTVSEVFWQNRGTQRRPSRAEREASARFGLSHEETL